MKFLLSILLFLGLILLWLGLAFSQDVVIIDDPLLCRLVARENFDRRLMWATDYVLEIQVADSDASLKVSYVLFDSSGTPQFPTQGIEVRGSEFIAGWDPGRQHFFRTEVGPSPQYLPFPHYRTVFLVLAGDEKMYAVFLRENDRKVTAFVLEGGLFERFAIPGLGEVRVQDGSLRIESFGGPVEVGLWRNGAYLHDEVAGYALPEFAANPKYYSVPLGLFMLAVARYGKIGVLIGERTERGVVATVLSGSRILEREEVPGLCLLQALPGPQVLVESLGRPVEVTHFSFDNTCYQWEVGGWARPEFRENPQVLPLKHYTPGFLLVSRYDRVGLFFYNENDGVVGILPVRGKGVCSSQAWDFSFALLREVAQKEGTNVLLSPLSLMTSLAILLGGACGETERSLVALFGFPGCTAPDVRRTWASLREELEEVNEDSRVTLSLACALWGREDVAFHREFLAESANLFGAHFEALDFGDPGALEHINAWIRERTEGRIKQLLERLRSEDLLVITEALCFKALWTRGFDPGKTQDAPFVLPDGRKKSWPMMEEMGDFLYFEDELLQIVALPYGEERRIRMCLLLPRQGVSLRDLLNALSAATWEKWRSALVNRRGCVRIPRFAMEYKGELKEALSALGVGIIFSPSASFCRLVDGWVSVSSIQHGAYIEVDERGTEASGATALVVSKGLPDLFYFVADKPFCFILEDVLTGMPLFVGILVNPENPVGKDFPLGGRKV